MRRFIFFVSLSIALFFFDRWGVVRPVRAVAEWTTRPVKKMLFQLKSGVREKFQDWGKIEEIEQLEKELQGLGLKNEALKIKLQEIKEENEAMRKLLGAPLPMDWNFQPVGVLGEEEGILIIDQGEREGVFKGMIAVWEKVLIGRVEEVSLHQAKIKTPLHKEAAILAKTQEANGLTASENKEIFLTKILQKEEINRGDLVVTAGGEGVYPADLMIGKVEEVILREEQPFKKARLKPMVEYEGLKTVFLIIE